MLDDTRPSELTTRPADLQSRLEPPAAPAGTAFDVCQGGLALRALVAVNGAVVLAVFATQAGWASALAALGPALAASLPAALGWLVLVCAARRTLSLLRPAARATALVALGAAMALVATWPLVTVGLIEASPLRWAALGAVGAAFALPLALWLETRERQRRPADAGAQLAELQSRIRPHFLFNTLNTAIALVRSDPARAEGVLEHLAELFRAALEAPGGNARTTLADELALARRYLEIEALRFGERLQVEWQIDPAAGAAPLPPLALQPLLENAVRHGIEAVEGGGTVRVRTRVRLGRAEIIIDNPLPTTAAVSAGHGLALSNVRERLRLLHDLDASFEAGPRDGRWFVRIAVPLEDKR
jgi:two-component system sensor histidine kinase AlgZ